MWQKIKNYYHFAQAFLAAAFFSFPSKEIKVIGVTGTDGKTTTVWKPLSKGFAINRKCADSAMRAMTKIASAYSATDRAKLGIDRFSGCFNNRVMRGGTELSMHAFACAIDFDAQRNQLKWGRDKARLAQVDCEAFWHAWEEEGWISLGRTRNFDWMHVQAARI